MHVVSSRLQSGEDNCYGWKGCQYHQREKYTQSSILITSWPLGNSVKCTVGVHRNTCRCGCVVGVSQGLKNKPHWWRRGQKPICVGINWSYDPMEREAPQASSWDLANKRPATTCVSVPWEDSVSSSTTEETLSWLVFVCCCFQLMEDEDKTVWLIAWKQIWWRVHWAMSFKRWLHHELRRSTGLSFCHFCFLWATLWICAAGFLKKNCLLGWIWN